MAEVKDKESGEQRNLLYLGASTGFDDSHESEVLSRNQILSGRLLIEDKPDQKKNQLQNRAANHISSTYVDQVTLPSFLISLEQFQSLNLPPTNNFRVQQGNADSQKNAQNDKNSVKSLMLNQRDDRKLFWLIILLAVFLVILVAAIVVYAVAVIKPNKPAA